MDTLSDCLIDGLNEKAAKVPAGRGEETEAEAETERDGRVGGTSREREREGERRAIKRFFPRNEVIPHLYTFKE